MRIIFIRHGESEGNVLNQINDDPKRIVSLTARGRAQAEAAAERLRDFPFAHAYTSEFPRAQQTAEILLYRRQLNPHVDARLNERHTGMDGMHVSRFSDFVRPDPLHAKPPGGESFLEEMERLRSFISEVFVHHPDGIVLAVSHENPIAAARAVVSGDPERAVRTPIANCEWLELEWNGPTQAAPGSWSSSPG